MITDGQGHVLLCERVDTTYQHIQTVQGGVDAGETPRQAAERELKEELGLAQGQFEIIAEAPSTYRYEWPEAYQRSIKNKDQYVGQEQTFFLALIPFDAVFHLDKHNREFSRVWWGTPEALLSQSWDIKQPGNKAALRYFGLI